MQYNRSKKSVVFLIGFFFKRAYILQVKLSTFVQGWTEVFLRIKESELFAT